MNGTNSKYQPQTFYTDKGVSIDTFAGTWDTTTAFEEWWSSSIGFDCQDPIWNGIVIRVKDANNNVTIYKRSADQWKEVGGSEKVTASSVEYDSGVDYPEGTVGNVIKSIQNNTGTDKFPTGTITAFDAHGLEKGSDISGLTPYQVLDKILNAEFAPKWTAATASLSIGTVLYRVGKNVPDKTSFNPSGNPASAQGLSTAKGGSVNNNKLTIADNTFGIDGASVTFGEEVATNCMIQVHLTRSYDEGDTQVVTSKGTPTKRVAYNLTTRWDVPNEDETHIDDSFHIKADSATTSDSTCATIYFCMPVWVDGQEASLAYSKTEYTIKKNLVAATDHSVSFEIPASYKDVKVYYFDTVINGGDWQKVSVTPTNETKTLGTQKYDYIKYTYTDDTLGEVLYKISFTIE